MHNINERVLVSDKLLYALDIYDHILAWVFLVDFIQDHLRCFVSTLLQLRKFLEQNGIGELTPFIPQGVLVFYHLG